MKIRCCIFFLLCWQTLCSQLLYKAAQDYFRHDPFKTDFSQFLTSLINDPTLSEKKINKKNDSTLFFIEGIYSSPSPFFFPASRCKIILAEQEEYLDSLSERPFTYFVYQLIGYAPPGNEGIKDVKEEFDKLNRRLKKGLDPVELKVLKKGSEQSGAIQNYRYQGMIFQPLTIAWVTSADHKENIIALSIRFFMDENKAYLPIPSNRP